MIVSAVEPKPIYLPRVRVTRMPCVESSGNYLCTRPDGHTGRHAATGSSGLLYRVWPDQAVSEPCS